MANINAERRISYGSYFTMTPARTLIPVLLLPLSVLMLISGFRATGQTASPVRLYVREVPLEVLGRKVRTVEIVQEDGTQGLYPQKSGGFNVEVVNQLKVPTSLHWHGLILPALMDGVPFVSQEPIPPNGTMAYKFPLIQSGTYWMHSHYGLQEQLLNAAPLIIDDPEERGKADQQVVILLSDFSFKSPEQILSKLKGGMENMKGMEKPPGTPNKDGMPMKPMKQKLLSQQWDESTQRFVAVAAMSELPDTDVKYDALLANRRTLENPQVFRVKAGQTVLLRIIDGSAATNFFVSTGELATELTAVDGKDVSALHGNFFQLGTAQRIDLRTKIPDQGGVFPILAQGEGTGQRCGVILATEGKTIPKLSTQTKVVTAGLDNTQELRLVASHGLAEKPVDRTLQSILGGSMASYDWTINGHAYPNRDSLDVREGERVEILFRNDTNMAHPMHLHGHDFQVVEIDGKPVPGALRDTLLVPPRSAIKVRFDANNPGLWAFHCHILYHLATGMFTVLKYEGANTEFWQPEKTLSEIPGLEAR
jgi:FtsP/CotA-like multicopper oxidase with cupredoxin domain